MQLDICIKHNIKGNWLTSSEDEVLSSMTYPGSPLSKTQKIQLPVFGFNKLKGHKSNAQQYPVKYIILELDTPSEIKNKIKAGCTRTFQITQAKFWMWYTQFKHDPLLNYYWMYLTPSTCGIRFVLKLDVPVNNEDEYIHAVRSFLKILYKKTNGGINQNHFDILVNQGWFVPTFSDCFDARGLIYSVPLIRKNVKVTPPIYGKEYKSNFCSDGKLQSALNLTQKKKEYKIGQRNKFIFSLACNCNRFGIPEPTTLNFIKSNYDLGFDEIEKTVRSAYNNNLTEFGKYINTTT